MAKASSFCVFLLAVLASAQTIHVDTSHHVNSFRPTEALGAAVDRLPDGAPEKLLSKPVLDKVLQAGWQTVTYRQNTELRIQAWHWNPRGHWSNQAKQQGYFTGDATPSGTLTDSYGYSLPDRGFTRNDGTLSGYSRLTDGDLHTYWKSNPYLTRAFTHEDDSLHPQWVILDLRTPQDINAMRIAWAAPYARTYFVQFWTGSEDPIKNATEGVWETFPSGAITNGKGGTVKLRLSRKPVRARYLRVWMTQSSDTCDDHGSQDRRNCVGYAISEVYAGSIASDGTFHDATRHSPDQRQTTTWCSSIDPWHNASDLDKKAGEQTGFDLFFRSGVTRGLPAMIPIAMLYGTPENSAAEIQYLENRHYPISYVEMGEEPDGQYMLPEDYAALYLQWATALHKVDPKLKLGGPIFTGVNEDIKVWPDAEGRVSWLGRFLDYLKTHGRFSDLAFMSFEHYPFAPCQTTWDDLYKEPYLIKHIMQVWRQDGLPPNVPMFDTETNLSWNLNKSFVTMFGGLWVADSLGSFLTGGGSAYDYFHYLPLPLHRGCDGWGTFSMQVGTRDWSVKQPTAQFFAAELINKDWVQPGSGLHKLFLATSDIKDAAGHVLVTAYAVVRPDGKRSLMLVNRDREHDHQVSIAFEKAKGDRVQGFTGPVRVVSFGSAQYHWHPDGANGYADPDGPPVTSNVTANRETMYTVPKASITVLTGRVQ